MSGVMLQSDRSSTDFNESSEPSTKSIRDASSISEIFSILQIRFFSASGIGPGLRYRNISLLILI